MVIMSKNTCWVLWAMGGVLAVIGIVLDLDVLTFFALVVFIGLCISSSKKGSS